MREFFISTLPWVFLAWTGLLLFIILTELSNFIMTHVPFVPTRKKDIEDLVKRVNIQPGDKFYDIGSGNGKVVFLIEKLTGAQTMGLQRAGWTQTYAKLKKRLIGSKARFISGNFFDHPWQEANVIYAYLYPFLMSQVGEKAMQDCRPGTKIIARDFYIPNLRLSDSWQTPSNHKIYLYII